MKGKRAKIVVATIVIVFLISTLSAVFIGFFEGNAQKQTSASHYLPYQGSTSRILLESKSSLTSTQTPQTYISLNGQQIAKGSYVYATNVTLRNDYSSDDPPPFSVSPTAPIDGTAYICLDANLVSNGALVPAINLSPQDFTAASPNQTGIVLASGQTATVQLVLASNQTQITDFTISLGSVTDSIPR